jgi:ABC-2 type transport system permease protein
VLPLDKSPIPSFYLQNLFSFLNLGLAGFVLSAIAVRFVFPAVSQEGRAFWIIKTSPLALKKFLSSKLLMGLLPLLILAEVLTLITNYLLNVTPFMMFLSLITIFLMTFGITSLGVGMGALYPRFRHGNAAEIPSGFGGLIYMIYAMALIGLTIILEARPVYMFFMSHFRKFPLSGWFYVETSLAVVVIVLVNLAAVVLPIRYGLRHLEQMETIE